MGNIPYIPSIPSLIHGTHFFPWEIPKPRCYRSTAADALDQVLAEDLEDSPEKTP